MIKTNAMRILETLGISFTVITYECDEFIDGVHLADKLGQPRDKLGMAADDREGGKGGGTGGRRDRGREDEGAGGMADILADQV